MGVSKGLWGISFVGIAFFSLGFEFKNGPHRDNLLSQASFLNRLNQRSSQTLKGRNFHINHEKLISSKNSKSQPPHIDINAPSVAYYPYIQKNLMQNVPMALQPILFLGERNLEWLKHINLTNGLQLSFSSKESMRGYPIDAPSFYNESIIEGNFNNMKQGLPLEMGEVLLEGKPFTDLPPIAVEEYLTWGRKIDRIYQSALRWQMMRPWLPYLENERWQDIRGYFFLEKEEDLDQQLVNWSTLPLEKQQQLKVWLVGLCNNTENQISRCESKLNQVIVNNSVLAFYRNYVSRSKVVYERFFQLGGVRRDIRWTSQNPYVLEFPFTDPKIAEVRDFLKINIEDEWKLNGWNLLLKFFTDGSAATYVEFVPGTTPHVNGIAGNKIVMDANAPLTEYDVQWTIRHEFGHVLGFVDCYVEFYESENQWIVNYQLDLDNLMCSRKGRLQQTHFDELKRHYFENQ